MSFISQPQFSDGDGFYAALVKAHEGLNEEESQAFNARLILLMANQIGAQEVLLSCIEEAKNG